ncbi:hypothetical protein FJY94_02865 [Candidatus Kaiserbacteria bacterium]|nr:hypothetical protein [Candidatus Kaiserbacteria bacterium]
MDEPIRWEALEHEHLDQESDWFWALGIVAICSAITSILFKDFFFALVIIAAAITIALIAKRPPELMEFEINERGIVTHGKLHTYKHVLAFWVGHTADELPVLFIDTTTFLSPNLYIPIGDTDPDVIRQALLDQDVVEREMSEQLGHRIMRFFGF